MTSPVARRYALALANEAETTGTVAAVDADLARIAEVMHASPDLRAALASPVVPRDKKRRVVEAVFPELSATTARFVALLFDKEREGVIGGIASAYGDLRDTQNGIVEAEVRVPSELSADDAAALTRALEAHTGKRVRLRPTVDADMIGGLVVRIGDTVYDGSVRQQLARLHERLLSGATAPALN